MNKTTRIVRRNPVLTMATVMVAVLSASSAAWARGDYVVHIDIPEIGNSGGSDRPLIWTDGYGLDDPLDLVIVGPIIGGGPISPFPDIGGAPEVGVDPFSTGGFEPAEGPSFDIAPDLQPIDLSNPVSSVPAPGSAVLLGLVGASVARRRRR